MPELTTLDVQKYTKGRLTQGDTETTRLLATGLGLARRYCGWHVTPVIEDDVVTVDGPGGPLLVLPTLRLIELTALTEDGIDADLDQIAVSARGLVRKRHGYTGGRTGWYWSEQFGGIEATMTHGFAEAPEWQSAILSWIDRTSLTVGSGQREAVGPFTFAETPAAAGSAFTDTEKMLLDLYKLETPA